MKISRLKSNINPSSKTLTASVIAVIFLTACSPFSMLKTEFEPKEINISELNLTRDLYYANTGSMRKMSSLKSDLKSFEIEGVIADSRISKGFNKISPKNNLNFTGRIYKYKSSFLERTLGGAEDFRCFYEINFHSKKFAMPRLMAPQIYDFQCGKND